MLVTIYCDTTGLFSESEMYHDNMCEMEFEEWIVEEWFEKYISASVPYGFEVWYFDEYTADDTDGLYQFAINKGKNPTFEIGGQFSVFYREDHKSPGVAVFSGSYDECREFGKRHFWTWKGNDLGVAGLIIGDNV